MPFGKTINVVLVDCDEGIRGSTSKKKNGTYRIAINARLDHEQQVEACAHEIRHICNSDFGRTWSEIE